MKLKLLFTAFIGAVAINGVVAGDYCVPTSEKCPIECCPENNGEVSFGYHTDYILHGVRHLRDNVRADVNYTFDLLSLPVTLGATQITGLGSTSSNWDESDVYASVQLPGFMGIEANVGYIHRMFPNLRLPNGGNNGNNFGDSRGEVFILLSKEIFCGVNLSYRRGYDLNAPSAFAPLTNNTQDSGAWIHTLGVDKDFCLTDCATLNLSGGVLYTDNLWPSDMSNGARNRSSGWNSYYVRATVPIKLGCNVVMTPYVGYNGSPDTWIADGVDLIPNDDQNANDVLNGGVTISVGF